jgi:hypothetical protein
MKFLSVSETTPFCSHKINYGVPGTGKSINTKYWMEQFYKRGCKVIDLFDEFRLENAFYALPNPYYDMYEGFVRTVSQWLMVPPQAIVQMPKFAWQPRWFPTEVLFPALPWADKEVPALFKPFRIAFSDLSQLELCVLLGNLNPEQSEIIKSLKKSKKTLKEFIEALQDKEFMERCLVTCNRKEYLDILRRVDNLNQTGFICEKEDPLALDLEKILRDKGTITSFSCFNVEDRNTLFLIVGFLLRKIYALKRKQANSFDPYPETVIGIREIQNIAPARGQSAMYAFEGQRISAETLGLIVREPRDIKIRILADSQNPASIARPIRAGFGTMSIFRVDAIQLKAITELVMLPFDVQFKVQRARLGIQALKLQPSEEFDGDVTGVHFPVVYPPPESWCKSPDDSFFAIWRQHNGPFVDLSVGYPSIYEERASIINLDAFKPEGKAEKLSKTQEKIYSFYLDTFLFFLKYPENFVMSDILKNVDYQDMAAKNPKSLSRSKVEDVLEWGREAGRLIYDATNRCYRVVVPEKAEKIHTPDGRNPIDSGGGHVSRIRESEEVSPEDYVPAPEE